MDRTETDPLRNLSDVMMLDCIVRFMAAVLGTHSSKGPNFTIEEISSLGQDLCNRYGLPIEVCLEATSQAVVATCVVYGSIKSSTTGLSYTPETLASLELRATKLDASRATQAPGKA